MRMCCITFYDTVQDITVRYRCPNPLGILLVQKRRYNDIHIGWSSATHNLVCEEVDSNGEWVRDVDYPKLTEEFKSSIKEVIFMSKLDNIAG